MIKRKFLLLALLFLMTGVCLADAASDLQQGQAYEKSGSYGLPL